MFGGQRRYGKPPVRFRQNYHQFSTYSHTGEHANRDRTHQCDEHKHDHRHGQRERQSFECRCFHCGNPKCKHSPCKEPKIQERILANLEALRKLKKVNCLLRQINLDHIESEPFVVTESLTPDIYLEHAAQTTNG